MFLSYYYFQWKRNIELPVSNSLCDTFQRGMCVNYSDKNFIFYHRDEFFNFPTILRTFCFYFILFFFLFFARNLYTLKNIYRFRYYTRWKGEGGDTFFISVYIRSFHFKYYEDFNARSYMDILRCFRGHVFLLAV